MVDLPTRIQSSVAARMVANEQILWTGRPIPRHSWTIIGTTNPHSRRGRAISIVAFELCALMIFGVGMFLMFGFFALVSEFDWKISEIVGLILLAPLTVFVLGAGVQAMSAPLDMIRWAREAWYVLTTHSAFVVWKDDDEINVKKVELERTLRPDVYRLADSGVGDVVFDVQVAEFVGGDSSTSDARFDRGFFAVSNARAVAAKVSAARAARIHDVYGVSDC